MWKTHESDDFEEAAQFDEKHTEHTGHEMEWVRANIDFDIDPLSEWEIQCPTCNEVWRFESENRANNFRREHGEYTDHEITEEPIEKTVTLTVGESFGGKHSMRQLIAELEGHFEKGAPEKAIYAQFSSDPNDVAAARSEIQKLKQRGELYEPRTGHLRTT